MEAEKDGTTISIETPDGKMSEPVSLEDFDKNSKALSKAIKLNPTLAGKVVGLASLKDEKKETVDQYNTDIKEREAEITSMAREILDGQGNLFKK